jgi:hypothetical protein
LEGLVGDLDHHDRERAVALARAVDLGGQAIAEVLGVPEPGLGVDADRRVDLGRCR